MNGNTSKVRLVAALAVLAAAAVVRLPVFGISEAAEAALARISGHGSVRAVICELGRAAGGDGGIEEIIEAATGGNYYNEADTSFVGGESDDKDTVSAGFSFTSESGS